MLVFSIDGLPLYAFGVKALDYNSKIVYSSIADPLFRYDRTLRKYVPHACASFFCDRHAKKYVLNTRNDLYYSDGTKVGAEDYVIPIQWGLSEHFGIDNVKVTVEKNTNTILIRFPFTVKLVPQMLSHYLISPEKNGLTSGPYTINKITDNSIEVKRNQYFRLAQKNREANSIIFRLSKNHEADLIAFTTGETNMTCNTTFPVNSIHIYKDDLYIEPSGICLTINFCSEQFLAKNGRRRRRFVLHAINRLNCCNLLQNTVVPANDFFASEYNVKKDVLFNPKCAAIISKKNLFPHRELVLAYDDYYPNEIIARSIAHSIERFGISVKLVVDDFALPNQECDMRIVLIHPDYFDKASFYLSGFFLYLMHLYGCGGIFSLPRICGFKAVGESSKEIIIMKQLHKTFLKVAPKIPVLKMQSIYMASQEFGDFSFLSMNYYDL